MPIPTAQQVEGALRKVGGRLLVASPTVLLGFCHDWLVSLLPNMTNPELSSWLVWLGLSTLLVTSFLLFYFYQYRVTKKALLKLKPDYFVEQRNDQLWKRVERDRAREKNKT